MSPAATAAGYNSVTVLGRQRRYANLGPPTWARGPATPPEETT